MHASGLVHRDIKTHNVMLADDGRVVLMDFGTGRELEDRSASDLTGTPIYVAPEVLDGRPATAQSDVYSLGVLLFHLLTRSYPVRGRNLGDLRAAHDTNSRATLRAARPDAPASLARAIDRAINPALDCRYTSAAAFGAALRDATEARSRRRPLYGAVAAMAVLAAGGLTWYARGPSTRAQVPSIAVLPFDNQDGGPGSEEFADGLTNEIQQNLAVIEGLSLRSSGSSFVFKESPRDLHDVAAQLGVDFVLEGSVSRPGRTLQIDARFTRASGNAVVWTNSFNRDAKALPDILDEISLAIVNELRVTLGQSRRRYDLDPDLDHQFLRARAFHGRRGPENSSRAAELFQEVVSKAPSVRPCLGGPRQRAGAAVTAVDGRGDRSA